MPEGPEIRRAADRLGKALIGKKIVQCRLPYATFTGREHLIEEQMVIDVTSQAKAMWGLGTPEDLDYYVKNKEK